MTGGAPPPLKLPLTNTAFDAAPSVFKTMYRKTQIYIVQ